MFVYFQYKYFETSFFSSMFDVFFLLFEGAGGPYSAGAGGGGRESHPPPAAQGPRQRQVKNIPFTYQKFPFVAGDTF